MRLLYVTEGTPNRDPRLGDGSSMIPFEVIRHLPESVTITLLTFVGDVRVPPEISARCEQVISLPTRGRYSAISRSLVSRHAIGAAERATRRARQLVADLSGQSDVTLLHGPHVAFLARWITGPLVVQVVDPWSMHVAMDADLATGLRRGYRRFKARQAMRSESLLPQRARLLTVGRRDARQWSKNIGRSVTAIENGAERSERRRSEADGRTVCFIGSLNYGPNIDSATRLVREVAPLVWAAVPEAQFVLAGRQPVAAVLALQGQRVTVLADVSSVSEVFDSADVAVFCDRYGVGVRNSVTEAIAAGIPTIATSAAAREQPDHPLLMVIDDIPALAHAVVSRLDGSTPAPAEREGDSTTDVRTWELVASSYLDECERAIAAFDVVES